VVTWTAEQLRLEAAAGVHDSIFVDAFPRANTSHDAIGGGGAPLTSFSEPPSPPAARALACVDTGVGALSGSVFWSIESERRAGAAAAADTRNAGSPPTPPVELPPPPAKSAAAEVDPSPPPSTSGGVRGACSCCGWCGRRAKTEEAKKVPGGVRVNERVLGEEGEGGRLSGASRVSVVLDGAALANLQPDFVH